jgi:hypothetical protein
LARISDFPRKYNKKHLPSPFEWEVEAPTTPRKQVAPDLHIIKIYANFVEDGPMRGFSIVVVF